MKISRTCEAPRPYIPENGYIESSLTSVTQTVLRMRAPNWMDAYSLGDIARATAECASLVNADASDQNAAIVELWRRRR
jgi:hypothetical protein